MIFAIDVFYNEDRSAKAAGVLFEHWEDSKPKLGLLQWMVPIAFPLYSKRSIGFVENKGEQNGKVLLWIQ